MKLAVVTGQIVCTVRHQGLAHDKLLMVEMIDARGNPDGQCAVAIDSIGAGTGEWVLLVSVKRGELFKIDLQLIQDNQKRHNGELFKIKSAVV